MDNKNEQVVFHVRSSQRIISTGYRLYMGNFRKLMRRTWIFGIIYAIVIGFLMKGYLQIVPQYLQMANIYLQGNVPTEAIATLGTSTVIIQVMIILFYFTIILLYSPVFSAMNEHQETSVINPPEKWYGKPDWHMTLRMLKLGLWFFALYVVIAIIIALFVIGLSIMAKPNIFLLTCITLLLGVLALLFMLPLVYTGYKYMLTPKTHFLKVLSCTYSTGIRHWGSIFLVCLIVGIVTTLLSAVIMLPYYILTFAITMAQIGMLGGDPMGMPDYMNWMSVIVFIISGFILAYLSLSTLFPFYYLYGSIEQEERERKNLKIEN